LSRLFEFEAEASERLGERFRLGFEDQNVSGTHTSPWPWRIDAQVVSHEAEQLCVALVEAAFDVTEVHAGGSTAFGNPRFGDIGTAIEALEPTLLARRHQPPAD